MPEKVLEVVKIPVRQYDSKIHCRPTLHGLHIAWVRFVGADTYMVEYFWTGKSEKIPGYLQIDVALKE